MLTLKKAQQIINSEIKKRKILTEPQDLYNPINYILSLDGKRIRPSLCLMACNLFSDEYSNALGAALALEVFHNFTLLHDDIMDKASLRRGNPTVHKKWNNNIAILSGDAMCIKAYEYLATTQPDKLIKVFKLFNHTALQVCEGQQFDMEYEDQPTVTIEEYMKMIELKTSVLIASCLEIGAIIGGASDLNAHHLYNFGLNAGLAFQLQDDLLDIFGDEQHFGKEIGKDIISNKKTFLLIKALELAQGDFQKELKKWLSAKKFDSKEKVRAITNIYKQLSIQQITEDQIENFFQLSKESLAKVDNYEKNKEELEKFLQQLKVRNR
jgi:geranylgeranyl diphosphate synthase, type II